MGGVFVYLPVVHCKKITMHVVTIPTDGLGLKLRHK